MTPVNAVVAAFVALMLVGVLPSGCAAASPPVCELEPHIAEHVAAEARDCGRWDGADGGMAAATRCAEAAMDAGESFHFRIDSMRTTAGHWGPSSDPYPTSEVFGGTADAGWFLFYDSPLGGRVLKANCGRWEFRHSAASDDRELNCADQTANQELCNHNSEHREAGKRHPEP